MSKNKKKIADHKKKKNGRYRWVVPINLTWEQPRPRRWHEASRLSGGYGKRERERVRERGRGGGGQAAEAPSISSSAADLRREASSSSSMAAPNTYAVHVSSETHKIETWCQSDEALARQLQEEEDSRDATTARELAGNVSLESSPPVVEYRPANNAAQVAREDSVDPDNMSYEQLQAFGETVGTESRGLSDDLICYLVPFRNKCTLFSSKKNHEECVICKLTYKSRQKLIRLPCSHCYHAHCITRWLKINKACPVCNEEVFG